MFGKAALDVKDSGADAGASLKAQVDANPNDPQALFQYADYLDGQGRTDEAIAYYQRILQIDPNLARVHLNLGLIYYRQENYPQARGHFVRALETGRGSSATKDRIQAYIDQIDRRQARSLLTGFVLGGLRFQTNPAAAPDSTTDPNLNDFQRGEEDVAAFVAGNLRSVYRLNPEGSVALDTTAELYGSKQFEIDDLDLIYLSGKTGPRFRTGRLIGAPRASTAHVFVTGSYSNLGGDAFYGGVGLGGEWTIPVSDIFTGGASYTFLHRNFNEDNFPRSDANDHTLSAKGQWRVAGDDAIKARLGYRHSDADRDSDTLNEFFVSADYEFRFGSPLNANAASAGISLGLSGRFSEYDAPDPTVNPTVTRESNIYKGTITSHLPFNQAGALLLSVGHTIADSNITVYDYDNTQAMAGLAWFF
ncbi:unnamed protein product [Symbiodinium microadriaticum]|nr:unnamed protein product [Symbiodinium microadriaticum]